MSKAKLRKEGKLPVSLKVDPTLIAAAREITDDKDWVAKQDAIVKARKLKLAAKRVKCAAKTAAYLKRMQDSTPLDPPTDSDDDSRNESDDDSSLRGDECLDNCMFRQV